MIYSVTVHIEDQEEPIWFSWMKKHHIPDVMATGLFETCRMMRSELTHKKGFATYVMQYELTDAAKLKEYEDKHADRLRNDVILRFEGKLMAERDVLKPLESWK